MATPTAANRNAASRGVRQSAPGKSRLSNSDIPALDWIHIVFLFYSGAHNCINAWNRAENGLFFIFVLVGILSVELMLWAIYKHWKNGDLVGKMLKVGKLAGFAAFFYATAGILAQAQTGGAGDWTTVYYAWILPSSAPAMFAFAFWIQASNPITAAERDATAYAQLTVVEERREKLDHKRLSLSERKQRRQLKAHVFAKKMVALWKESDSRRVKTSLASSAKEEMPRLLEEAGVSVKTSNGILGKWTSYQLPAKTSNGKTSLN